MRRVLVVDDAKNIRLLLTKCLEAENYQVTASANGREALELLLQDTFDLIFLDIKLPEMSGTEVLRQIRSRGVDTPVIIVTAYPTVKNAVECTRLGSITYLQKPFTAERLHAVLKELSLDRESDGIACTPERIEALLAQQHYEEALWKLKEALAKDPTNSGLYDLFAQAYEGLGDETSAKRFRQAAKAFES